MRACMTLIYFVTATSFTSLGPVILKFATQDVDLDDEYKKVQESLAEECLFLLEILDARFDDQKQGESSSSFSTEASIFPVELFAQLATYIPKHVGHRLWRVCFVGASPQDADGCEGKPSPESVQTVEGQQLPE